MNIRSKRSKVKVTRSQSTIRRSSGRRELCTSSYSRVAGVKRSSVSVCPHDNSKTNDPKVFKHGTGNDHGISYKILGLKGQMSRSQGHKVQNILKEFQ